MRRFPLPLLGGLLLGVAGCAGGDPKGDAADGTDGGVGADGADGSDGADGGDGTDGSDSTDGADGAEPCVEDSAATLPDGLSWEEVTWIELDGLSEVTFSLGDPVLSDAWEGSYGTYDLNTVPLEAANGFRLERPGRVVAARAQWAGLGLRETAAPLYFWPDFSSDGYFWDTEHPSAVVVRCLTDGDAGEWVDHVLPEAIDVPQALHVFAGFRREEGGGGPAILSEDFFNDSEPYFAGVRFLGVDDELYYLGLSSSWYVNRVRIGVVYEPDIAAADKPFQVDEALSASSRAAWGDYDNDGDDDLMTNGPQLWRNNGDGSFTDVTSTAISALVGSGGGVWGDYDNDGCLDFFGQGTSYAAGELLLHNNCDGTLSDVTALSGIDDLQTERDCDGDGLAEHAPTEGAAWFDLDNDGWLDLYMANYECSSDFDYFENYDDRVWRNRGDGSFEDWTLHSGIPQDNQAGRGVTTGDVDQDGDADLYVANYRLDKNFFLENVGDGTLTDIANDNGTRGDLSRGAYGHSIGAAFGDIDNDGDFDLVVGNLAHPFYYGFSDRSNVFIHDGAGGFVDERDERGIYYRETHSNPTLFDADNDGDLDLFITAVYAGRDSDFYRNDGTGHFRLDNHESGLVQQNGWGSAAADYDQDGDVDLVAYALFRNDTAEAGGSLQVTAVGDAGRGGLSNRSAIGAVVEVTAGDERWLRQVSGGSGTGVQDSLTQHFGLGAAAGPLTVSVRFPGGPTVTVADVAADSGRIWVKEDGSVQVGWAHPGW